MTVSGDTTTLSIKRHSLSECLRSGGAFARRLLLLLAMFMLVNLGTARFFVSGDSMQFTLSPSQLVLVSRLSYHVGMPERGDIAVFHDPSDPDRELVKRVVGLPGETVELRAQQIYINGVYLEETYRTKPCDALSCSDGIWQLGPSEYFVMGDNRSHSRDSRSFGPIERGEFVGEAIFRYWPLIEFGWIE